jgi:L-ascorbate metabolism protein UlaG (beta-lactamase superfamily)
MRLTWYGHAAFLVEGTNDEGEPVRIITDPYKSPDCGGYAPVDDTADIVTLSHENPVYHSDLSSIRGDYEAVWGLKLPHKGVRVKGVPIRSRRVFENDARDPEGENAMVRFSLEGLEVSHLGDLGHALNDEEMEFLRGTHVLLALAGGPPTIQLPHLKALEEELEIPVILPMHYAVPGIKLNLQPVEAFTSLFPPERVVRVGSPSMEISRDTLPDQTTIYVLDHLR